MSVRNNSQTKRTIKTQNPKDKTITWNKETQMTGQHYETKGLQAC